MMKRAPLSWILQDIDYQMKNSYSRNEDDGEEEVKSTSKLLLYCDCRRIGHLSLKCSYGRLKNSRDLEEHEIESKPSKDEKEM